MARAGLGRLLIAGVFVAVATGLWYSQEADYRNSLSWEGVTTWESPTPLNLHRVLRNDGYLVGWSDLRVNPLWVSYWLNDTGTSQIGDRPGFKRDWRTLWPVSADSYRGSGYDRGHLAPNYAIANVHGREAQRQTFLMSNMSPQRPNLNRQLWQRLEEAVMDHFVPRFGTLQVITGPIYPADFLEGVFHRVGFTQVPEAFYKILVVPSQTPRVIAFIMPQQVSGNEPLDRFLVSVDKIEARTGLDFFPQLTQEVARRLEGNVDTHGWDLQAVARRPGRFQ
ncbi:DNA/RNA non-specific endonuclease [Halomonas salinarum]|uniref:DNA/RNA non-specific endonuclease n=1 Tax=Halomonas salinarum TaxID=1158993 RepID=UPI001FD83291|nr:DNA/RNA non-specific endonuclease [Halomonas salinarum]